MARAVLEREGYAVAVEGDEQSALTVDVCESGWPVSAHDGEWNGVDFASLAAFLRGRRTRT